MKFILYAFCANIVNIVKNYLVENNAPFVYIILLSFVGSCFGFMFMNCILEWKKQGYLLLSYLYPKLR